MDESLYQPIPTREIPMPNLDGAAESSENGAELPRILRQVAGSGSASRRLLLLTGAFLALAVFEILLLIRIPAPEPLVVYRYVPRPPLTEPER